MEGLSRPTLKEKGDGVLDGMHISLIVMITHLLFVDDVLLFGKGSVEYWQGYKGILELFSGAIGMSISGTKYFFLSHGLTKEVLD